MCPSDLRPSLAEAFSATRCLHRADLEGVLIVEGSGMPTGIQRRTAFRRSRPSTWWKLGC